MRDLMMANRQNTTERAMHMYGMYCRLNLRVSASNITVIRAVRRKFRRGVRRDPAFRQARKDIYRQMLGYHAEHQKLVREWRL